MYDNLEPNILRVQHYEYLEPIFIDMEFTNLLSKEK